MFRKFSSKLTRKEKGNKCVKEPLGAAVPYKQANGGDVIGNGKPNGTSVTGETGEKRTKGASDASGRPDGILLAEAVAKGEVSAVRQALRSGVDVNVVSESGVSPLHLAATKGHSKVVRYLLLHGANVEARNAKNQSVLHAAVDSGFAGTVGVLLDYMHSVDNRPRDPFVMVRGAKKGDSYLMEEVSTCGELQEYKRRGTGIVQLLIAHGQRADDLAVFLYSVLDVPVAHAFFLNTRGDLNMRNFQRFESKTKSLSITILNTTLRVMEAASYQSMRSLILVSCGLVKLTLSELPSLELIDVRYNKLETLPSTLKECPKLRTLRCAHNALRKLPLELGFLRHLMAIDVSFNSLKRLPASIVKCTALRSLQIDNNWLLELPIDIGLLASLEELRVDNNKLSQLPLSIAVLSRLDEISFHSNPLLNIPVDFPERATEVREYLGSLQQDPVPNKTVKLVIVGQEGVGKTSLLNALKRTFWVIPRTQTTEKTEGVDVKDIQLDDTTLRCFDCGGDVDFNETHNFFITQGALYLVCFNMSEYCLSTVERDSFLLGRLQLWLQYIFSRVPNAQVMIIGTHADHESLSREVFEEIWEKLRELLVDAREHHTGYFRGVDRMSDCLLCQADCRCLRRSAGPETVGFVNLGFNDEATDSEDETSFSEGPSNAISFPHILGYYEVSSVKAVGRTGIRHINVNQSIEHVKTAIRRLSARLIEQNPCIPRRWADVQKSLRNHIALNPADCVATVEQVEKIARAQGIVERTELDSMLQFFKAQGYVLYFPQLPAMADLVILDPEWLAKIFSSVVSFRDTGIDDNGFMKRDALCATWSHVDDRMRDKLLTLLHHFGICLPVGDGTLQLFPCKLPIGEPDETAWSSSPATGERQLTYTVTFPSCVPPPFFGDLTVYMFRNRAEVPEDGDFAQTWRYYANHILDNFRLKSVGCRHCAAAAATAAPSGDTKQLLHRVHVELIPHRRTLVVTVRGAHACCMVRQVVDMLNKVVRKFEGLGTIELDTLLCPGCYMQGNKDPHRFSAKQLASEGGDVTPSSDGRVICRNAHVLGDARTVLTGAVNDSCLPTATLRPKSDRDRYDFSGCPRMFIMLPVNRDGLSFDRDLRLFASSLVYDGFAGHMLCEFPDGYHLTQAPGYRLRQPVEFMREYGEHVLAVLRLLRHVSGSTVSPQYATRTRAVTKMIDALLRDMSSRFPGVRDAGAGLSPDDVIALVQRGGRRVTREQLRRYFHVTDSPDAFGPLRRLYYGDQEMWLCNEHFRQMRVLTIGTVQVDAHVESIA